jgi:hypothetical protein
VPVTPKGKKERGGGKEKKEEKKRRGKRKKEEKMEKKSRKVLAPAYGVLSKLMAPLAPDYHPRCNQNAYEFM